jgi:glycosyltransferase involved in cell wall biosynthesis
MGPDARIVAPAGARATPRAWETLDVNGSTPANAVAGINRERADLNEVDESLARRRPMALPSNTRRVRLARAGATGAAVQPNEDDNRAWPLQFAHRHGRQLRVLHVGNIANNAFLNAKFLRQAGVEADVLCYDYYHVMGTPEWEEVELRQPYGDDFKPRFAAEDLVGYDRPAWFIQGPLTECHGAVIARRPLPPIGGRRNRWLRSSAEPRAALRAAAYRFLTAASQHPGLLAVWRASGLRPLLRPAVVELITRLASGPLPIPGSAKARSFVQQFAAAFPERPDRLSAEELMMFLGSAMLFREMFERYDIVQLYATDPMYGWLAGNRPYVGFEHGTLRDFTLGDNVVNRLTSMGYRQAQHVFITNGDCLEYAQKIGVHRYSPMIHPIDVEQHRSVSAASVAAVRAEYPADVLLLCPVRHSWDVKRTDIHLRALPLIRQRVQGRVLLLLTEWGEDVARSRELIAAVGCSEAVRWIRPLPRISMIKLTRAADVVLDQMALPHFGATAPQALSVGVPVISSYMPESTHWIIGEPAPILPAFSAEQVCDQVITALDPAWRARYQERARRWIDAHHHPRYAVATHLRVYRDILNGGHDHRQ